MLGQLAVAPHVRRAVPALGVHVGECQRGGGVVRRGGRHLAERAQRARVVPPGHGHLAPRDHHRNLRGGPREGVGCLLHGALGVVAAPGRRQRARTPGTSPRGRRQRWRECFCVPRAGPGPPARTRVPDPGQRHGRLELAERPAASPSAARQWRSATTWFREPKSRSRRRAHARPACAPSARCHARASRAPPRARRPRGAARAQSRGGVGRREARAHQVLLRAARGRG